MRWIQDLHTRFKIVIFILTVIFFGALIYQMGRTMRQLASLGWPSVTGEVQGVFAKAWEATSYNRFGPPKKVTKFFGRVRYRYLVAGKTYTSDLTDLGPGLKHADTASALGDVSQYHPGMQVAVYYDPKDPTVGIVEKGIPTTDVFCLIFFGLGAGGGLLIVFFIVHGWWRNRQKGKQQRLRREARRRKNRRRLEMIEGDEEDY